MPKPLFATVRKTIYILPETLERMYAAAGRRPLGHAVDDAFAALEMPVSNPVSKPSAGPPRVAKYPSIAGAAIATIPHPIACQCDACTLARLQSPQIRKAK